MEISCPFCQQTVEPVLQKKVSAAGWILFAVLLVFCFPLCWIPFILDACKEEFRTCVACGKTWK